MTYDGCCIGVVERTAPGRALVRIDPGQQCGACAGEASCSLGPRRKQRALWVRDPLGVREGQAVRVSLSDRGLVAATLVVYGIPLVGLLAGAGLGQATGGEKRAMLGAGLGLLASLPLVRWLGKVLSSRDEVVAHIVSLAD